MPNCFPKWLYHFTFHQQCMNSHCSVALSRLGIVSLFNFNYYNGWVVVSHCGFNLHFNDGQWCRASFHVLIVHLHIFWSVWVFSLFFLIGLSCYLSSKSSLYIPDTSPLSDTRKHFLPFFLACLLIFSTMYKVDEKVFKLDKVQFKSFSFIVHTFCVL